MTHKEVAEALGRVQLFHDLKGPIQDPTIRRILDWADWVGPESPDVLIIAQRGQEIKDSLLSSVPEDFWAALVRDFVEQTKSLVPYDDAGDAWVAANAAVWQAAWTVLLVALLEHKQVDVPTDLIAQYRWFARGRWPCARNPSAASDEPSGYVVL